MTHTQQNRLAHEQSPYLLQHADNPVDWFPWGEAAFTKAREEDKPIFLSIGYSTCHWCHVMAHESFEDPEVAALMNETFVNIKVDREERPDVDNLYMTVCQMLTRQGGWPLTIVMSPDKRPFYAGTYFPKHSRFGRPGMMDLVPQIKRLWAEQRHELIESAQNITEALRGHSVQTPGADLGPGDLARAYQQLAGQFDPQYGGFGEKPKFPTPHNLTFLLRHWQRAGEPHALDMVERTLQAMRRGGIYDHIGLGFHRYATDREWLLPHFEKMLYDQAMLAMVYLETYQATGQAQYAATAREIFTYVLRDMTAPEGGFYSAEDADSEGEEGKFYVWHAEEIRRVLDEDAAALIIRAYNVTEEGNFHEEATGLRTGANVLHLRAPLDALAASFDMAEDTLRARLESAQKQLFAAREERIHPHKDDKILTDWNGLMIAALAKGARILDDSTYAEAAERAAAFILAQMRTPEGRLLHRYRAGESGIPGMLDDYAFFIWGLLELYETTFEAAHLQTALALNDALTAHFWDAETGGFYTTPGDGEDLPVRRKEVYDGATPSGNSVAMLNLLRLGRITGESELEERAAQLGRVFSTHVSRAAMAYTQLLCALDFALGPTYEITVAGAPDAEDTRAMLRALRGRFVPNKIVLLRPGDGAPIIEIAPFTETQTPLDGTATAYVCQNYECKLPTTDPAQMVAQLAARM